MTVLKEFIFEQSFRVIAASQMQKLFPMHTYSDKSPRWRNIKFINKFHSFLILKFSNLLEELSIITKEK